MSKQWAKMYLKLLPYLCILVFLNISWAIDKIESDLSLVTKGDLLDLIRKKLKDESQASYKEAILYLKEMETRGSGQKDWEEYRVKQALALCYNSIGDPQNSYRYWSEIASLDTTKYFGERPKHLIVGSDVLYNRILMYQEAAFGSSNKASLDSLSQFTELVDSLRSSNASYEENPDLLFNKALFLSESGKLEEADEAILALRKGYPKFKYKERLDSLDSKNSRKKASKHIPSTTPG